jgi:phosphate transport system ATP-binding protein
MNMAQSPEQTANAPILSVSNLNLHYGSSQALKDVNLDMLRNQVTAFIGPSGCGKSTLLRCFNRMNDLVESCRIDGSIRFNGSEVNDQATDVISLRRSIGMVFQQSNPFPKSIYENIVYGLRISGVNDKATLDVVVERSL